MSLGINVIIIKVVHCTLRRNKICWGDLVVKVRNVFSKVVFMPSFGLMGKQFVIKEVKGMQSIPKPLLILSPFLLFYLKEFVM